MCGRFTLILEPGDLQDEFDLGGIAEDYTPRYNIAPTQPVAVTRDLQSKKVELFRWGLIPSWAKDPAIGNRLINARAETLHEKPSFRNPLAKRRNLIFSSGFYEWRQMADKGKPTKEPLFIHLNEQPAFCFAGLWEEWITPDGGRVHSTTIITCQSNELISEFHDRMPVILDKGTMWKWIDPSLSSNQAAELLLPYPSAKMSYHPVSTMVNSPKVDTPECLTPVHRLF